MKKKVILNHSNIRSEIQAKRMRLAEETNLCPFCKEGLKKIHQKKILMRNKSWILTESAFPYEGTAQHYLILPIKHITKVSEISKKSWLDFGELFTKTIKMRKIKGGGIFMRFGEMTMNGSSVEHLHAQVLSGEVDENYPKENRESLRVKLGYKKKV